MFIESILVENLRQRGYTEPGAKAAARNFLASIEYARLAKPVALPTGGTVWATAADIEREDGQVAQ